MLKRECHVHADACAIWRCWTKGRRWRRSAAHDAARAAHGGALRQRSARCALPCLRYSRGRSPLARVRMDRAHTGKWRSANRITCMGGCSREDKSVAFSPWFVSVHRLGSLAPRRQAWLVGGEGQGQRTGSRPGLRLACHRSQACILTGYDPFPLAGPGHSCARGATPRAAVRQSCTRLDVSARASPALMFSTSHGEPWRTTRFAAVAAAVAAVAAAAYPLRWGTAPVRTGGRRGIWAGGRVMILGRLVCVAPISADRCPGRCPGPSPASSAPRPIPARSNTAL